MKYQEKNSSITNMFINTVYQKGADYSHQYVDVVAIPTLTAVAYMDLIDIVSTYTAKVFHIEDNPENHLKLFNETMARINVSECTVAMHILLIDEIAEIVLETYNNSKNGQPVVPAEVSLSGDVFSKLRDVKRDILAFSQLNVKIDLVDASHEPDAFIIIATMTFLIHNLNELISIEKIGEYSSLTKNIRVFIKNVKNIRTRDPEILRAKKTIIKTLTLLMKRTDANNTEIQSTLHQLKRHCMMVKMIHA